MREDLDEIINILRKAIRHLKHKCRKCGASPFKCAMKRCLVPDLIDELGSIIMHLEKHNLISIAEGVYRLYSLYRDYFVFDNLGEKFPELKKHLSKAIEILGDITLT